MFYWLLSLLSRVPLVGEAGNRKFNSNYSVANEEARGIQWKAKPLTRNRKSLTGGSAYGTPMKAAMDLPFSVFITTPSTVPEGGNAIGGKSTLKSERPVLNSIAGAGEGDWKCLDF